jgi:hypothetical protein
VIGIKRGPFVPQLVLVSLPGVDEIIKESGAVFRATGMAAGDSSVSDIVCCISMTYFLDDI